MGQKGKRKFEERMTLTEAKLGDFQDSRDYVDFLQSKLQDICPTPVVRSSTKYFCISHNFSFSFLY